MSLQEQIPEQYTGKALEVSASVTAVNDHDAKQLWREAVTRFLSVHNWKDYSGGNADFEAVDKEGNVHYDLIREGDFMRIDLPGPSSEEGDGYDWVHIDKVTSSAQDNDTDEQYFLMQAKPCAHPFNKEEETAHFFNEKATSNFIVEQKGNTVTAKIIGRNEEINTEENSIISKIRNFFTGGGAKAGLSETQWQQLVDGIVAVKSEL